jgi:DNA-binding GntR family transcriptional regulator
MDFAGLSPVHQRTLTDEVVEQLRAAIRNGSLSPGTRLVERDLAKRLGVSRIPVREAIQRLAEEGLVKKVPHQGTFVYAPSRDEIEEISSLRVVLERFVVERVVARWEPDYEAELREIVAAMRDAASRRDLQQVYEQDYKFHHTLWEIADHSILLEVVSSLRSRIGRFLYEANSALPASQLDTHVTSHDELIEVLKSGDVTRAQGEMTQHVLGAKDRILTYCDLPSTSNNTHGTDDRVT